MSVVEKKILFTYDDLLNWEDDKFRHELIEGEHFMTPSPNLYHQKISIKLARYVSIYAEEKDLGEVFTAPTDVVLSDVEVLVPDLLFVSNKKRHILKENYIHGAPDLIVEILSPSSVHYDKVVKFKRYAYYGVLEYWLVDPEKHVVEVYDLEQQKLIKVFSTDAVMNTRTFPDIHLPLEKIF